MDSCSYGGQKVPPCARAICVLENREMSRHSHALEREPWPLWGDLLGARTDGRKTNSKSGCSRGRGDSSQLGDGGRGDRERGRSGKVSVQIEDFLKIYMLREGARGLRMTPRSFALGNEWLVRSLLRWGSLGDEVTREKVKNSVLGAPWWLSG